MSIKRQNSVKTALAVVFFLAAFQLQAQDWKSEQRLSVLFGLTQPVFVSGFNIEGNYIRNRFIFDYSHGVSLDFSGPALTDDLKRQDVVVHMPYTTGFGLGYRLSEWLNVRVEPKWHRFEIYYAGEEQEKANEITAFNTFSLGLGLYGSYRPFKNHSSFLKGLMIAPSIRYWPTVSSDLAGDSHKYSNKRSDREETIGTLEPGMGFTPWVFNVSVGYSFKL